MHFKALKIDLFENLYENLFESLCEIIVGMSSKRHYNYLLVFHNVLAIFELYNLSSELLNTTSCRLSVAVSTDFVGFNEAHGHFA